MEQEEKNLEFRQSNWEKTSQSREKQEKKTEKENNQQSFFRENLPEVCTR